MVFQEKKGVFNNFAKKKGQSSAGRVIRKK
jgi:hypothetical protein